MVVRPIGLICSVSSYDLKVGDILYDATSKDVGILVKCFDTGDNLVMDDEVYNIAAWEVHWMDDGTQFYSEYGITTRLSSEDFLLVGHV